MPFHENFVEDFARRFAKQSRLSKERGFRLTPELIEEILGSLGPGAIKKIAGVPSLFMTRAASSPVASRTGDVKFPVKRDFRENLELLSQQARRARGPANVDRPSTISSQGRRSNVGGQRPPEAELEALALRRQVRPDPKDMKVIATKLKELGFPDAGIVRFLASKSKREVSKMALRFKKELLASPPKPKGSGK